MNTTIAHRQHVHVPLAPIIAVLATVVVAAAVLILINQPSQTITSETTVSVAPATTAAEIARPETPALRRQLAETQAAVVPAAEAFQYPLNHVQGTTLDSAGSYELAPPAPKYLPGDVADPHPLNHFAAQPR